MAQFQAASGLQSGLATVPQAQAAQLRLQGMQTQNAEAALKLNQEQRYEQLLQSMATTKGAATGQAQTPSDQMMQLGLAAVRSGLPQGMNLINTATNMQYKAAEAAAATTRSQAEAVRAQVAQQQSQIQQHEQLMAPAAGMLAGVHDQATWDAYTHFMAARYNDSEFLGTPYSPQTVDQLRYEFEGVKNAIAERKNRLDQALKQAQLQERVQHDQTLERLGEARAAAEKIRAQAAVAQSRLAAEREARLAKTGGGKAVSPPPQSMVDQAQDMIEKQLPNMATHDAQDFAYSVAAEARSLMQKNPGMNAQAAIMQALSEQKDSQVQQDTTWYGSKKDKFAPTTPGAKGPAPVKESFKTPQEVVEAFNSGKIPRSEAELFLKAMGAH